MQPFRVKPFIALGLFSLLLASCDVRQHLSGLGKGRVDTTNLPPCVDDDCNCGDFLSQPQAQAVLEAFSADIYGLDEDGNRRACDQLPPLSPPVDPDPPGSKNPHLVLGNPSHASHRNADNYLLERPQYVVAYNRDRRILAWASWELDAAWLGGIDRQDDFRPDHALPPGFYQVTPEDYSHSHYDRGHVVPSGDRTRNSLDNSTTFLMTNILPQAPANNRGPWRELETYARDLVYHQHRSLHIFAGAYGKKPVSELPGVTVPSRLWKIIIVYDRLGNSRLGLTSHSQVIAVDMPNSNVISPDWHTYRTSIHRIEMATGYQFLTPVPQPLQTKLKLSLH
ncbi:MAG: DNA/RNA non-specific endonuclease [Cyanobacteria bacterium REEB459]|nr:DNA/RNA non-specific endonuclease [Cyanobacteria bacterium REEB459]